MTFLSPAFLWLLPVALAPLILHLLNKRPPKLMTFSHVKWIQDAHRKRMPKKKLKDVLLLIARACVLLFLVLFFARPVIRQGKLIGGRDDNSTLIVLVDVSASMGTVEEGRSALQRAANNLKDMLREMPAPVRLGLLAYSDRVEKEFAPTTDRSKVLAFLEDLSVAPRPTEIKPALDMAYVTLSRQSKAKKSVLILTDNQKSQWRALLQENSVIDQFDPTVSVIVWEVGRETVNHGVSNVSLQLTEEGTLKGGWNLNRSKPDRSDVPWTLKLNGNIVGQGVERDSAKSAKTGEIIPLEARLPAGGVYSGSLDLAPDAAGFDNTFYVAGRIPKGFRVLVVEGESGLAPSDSESYYLKLALESPRDPRLEQMRVVSAEIFSPEMLSAFDVLVLANVGNLKGSEDAVKAWVENGGNVFLTAGSRWQDARASLGLFRARAMSSNAQNVKAPDNAAELGLAGTENFEWAGVRVQKYIPIEKADDVKPLLVLANGDPLLVKKRVGRGSVMALASSIDRAWNNLPSKPVFSPLMRELLSRLADPVGEASLLQGIVDAPFEVRLPAGIDNVSVLGPDGTSTAARVDIHPGDSQGRLRVPPMTKPGLYRVVTNRKDADLTFAVNIDRILDEGNFERLSEGKLSAVFPKAYVQVIAPQTKSDAFVANALEGVDATPKLLFLLIFFLLVETVIGWPFKKAAVAGFILLFSMNTAKAAEGNRFVFTQLKHDGNWDPYPTAHEGLFDMIVTMTNIPLVSNRRVVELSGAELFEAPSLIVKGNAALNFTAKDKSRLKQYIDRGGFVFFDDTLADAKGPFGQSVRALMKELYPDQPLQKLSTDHAVFRSFFLLRNVAGRRISEKYLEGVDVGGQGGGEGRAAVIYCPNDLMGAWVKDNLGQYVYSCEPGGEPQRWESFKLMLNVVYFTLTGTYKKDAIHQPFIEKKLGL